MKRLFSFFGLLGLLGAAACDGRGLVTAEDMPWVRFVDSDGNQLVSQDGRFTISFPAGALKEGMAFEIRQLTPDAGRHAGLMYQVKRIDGGGGEIELRKPATVTLRWVDTPVYVEPPLLGRVGRDGAWVPEAFVREGGKLVARGVTRTGTFAAWDACGNDAGCAVGLICEGGACVEPACADASGCGAYQDCVSGRCVDRCGALECTPGVACDDRHACDVVEGCPRCVPVTTCPDTETNCLDGEDDDCDKLVDRDDPDCEVIACNRANNSSDCPRDMFCVEGTCRDCRDSYDCGYMDGEVCTLPDYTCEIAMCRSNADCPFETGCYEGWCVACPPPEYRCSSDLQCGKGYICEGWGNGCSFCQDAECTSNASCPDGEQCLGGRCVNERCTDGDADTFFAQPDCGTPQDCDDTNPSIYPGARERCNGKDDDCSGAPDDQDPYRMCPLGGYCMDGKCF